MTKAEPNKPRMPRQPQNASGLAFYVIFKGRDMVGVIVVNIGNPTLTLECLSSLYKHAGMPFHLVLIDNESTEESRNQLDAFVSAKDDIDIIYNDANEGFSKACNQGLGVLLADPRFTAVALLNNDSVIEEDWLIRMVRRLEPDCQIDMVAGCMMDFQQPSEVDNLGIVLYRCGVASNRKDPTEPLLGPCGGSALYSRRLIEKVIAISGYWLDPDFFCYAEDTDLALRARAVGFHCVLAEDAIVRHHGGASSGGKNTEFVAYYGLRNSLFAMIINLPPSFFMRNAVWILLFNIACLIKYISNGQPFLIWRVYRDFVRGIPQARAKRATINRQNLSTKLDLSRCVSNRIYDRHYIMREIALLYTRFGQVLSFKSKRAHNNKAKN